jgi:glycerol kinase
MHPRRRVSSSPKHRLPEGMGDRLTLVVAVAALVIWHIRRPGSHALEGAIFVGSLVIVWLGASLAH